MVHIDEIKSQLVEIGATNLMWGRAEIRELPRILFTGEKLKHVLNGRYEGGFALLCATDQRIILIDKKPFYLTLEDTRYEMISDVQFNHRLVDASIWIGTVHKKLAFKAYNHSKLRDLSNFIQQKAMESRQQQPQQTFASQIDGPQLPRTIGEDGVSLPVQDLLTSNQRPPINPYRMPVMVRRRVSRFY